MYPSSNIWLVGHSLGGALASLLGTTFGLPAVAFEAPGERLAAQRLHLPLPPSNDTKSSIALVPVTHVYHTADPIPQGVCTGVGSPCAAAGYALETRCHLGKSIVYDTVSKYDWSVDIRKHPIREVILKVIEGEVPEGGWDWEWECEESTPGGGDGCGGKRRRGRAVPVPKPESDCVVSTYAKVFCHLGVFRGSFAATCARTVTSGSLAISRTGSNHSINSNVYVLSSRLSCVYLDASVLP